jgi:hypothetical protein
VSGYTPMPDPVVIGERGRLSTWMEIGPSDRAEDEVRIDVSSDNGIVCTRIACYPDAREADQIIAALTVLRNRPREAFKLTRWRCTVIDRPADQQPAIACGWEGAGPETSRPDAETIRCPRCSGDVEEIETEATAP